MGRTRRSDIELTERQRQVLDLLARGHSNGEIAEVLGISLPGAKWHVSELMNRVGVESRDELGEWWEREQGLRTRTERLVRGLIGTGAAKLAAAAAAGAVVVAAAAAVVGLGSLGSGSTNEDSENVAPSISRSEAESRARLQLQGHLERIGFDLEYTINGHPLGAADFELQAAEFYPAATHLPSLRNGTPYLFAQPGIDVWRFTFKVIGVSEPATGGEFNAAVTVRDDLPDVPSAYIWGNQGAEHGPEGPQKLSEPKLLAQIDDSDRHFEVTVWRSVNGWCQFVAWNGGPGLGGHCGMAARPFGPGQYLDAAGIHGDRGYVDALVAVVSRDVAVVRFTAVDGSVLDEMPAGDPALPLAAVALRPPPNGAIVVIEAIGADGAKLAIHRVQGTATAGPPAP